MMTSRTISPAYMHVRLGPSSEKKKKKKEGKRCPMTVLSIDHLSPNLTIAEFFLFAEQPWRTPTLPY
jgi:hypothetical protein